MKNCYIIYLFLGTTALIALVEGSQLIVANVGDSRGVMCDSKGNTIPLSFDHKPDQVLLVYSVLYINSKLYISIHCFG